MNLRRNIIRIFSANFINLISSIVIGFIVPAILSIETYSYVKMYSFYITYVGVLHLGFIDGLYIKYGGKSIEEIDKGELKGEHNVLLISQLFITLIIVIISIICKDMILFLTAISIIPINILSFFNLLFQATGEFKKYSLNLYLYTFLYLTFNVLLAIVFKVDSYLHYCIITIIANLIVVIFLEVKFYDKEVKAVYNRKFINNIKVGFFILLGNLSVLMFYAIDRWFIKIFFSTIDFGYYSFALSLLNIINILVNSISITLFNHLSKNENINEIKKMKNYFLLLGGIASAAYFVLAAIISIFIPKYNPALNIISISFSAYPYMIIINALYVNLYKVRKKESYYAKIVAKMVVLSAVYNAISMIIYRNMISIAIATTISFITWYYYSMKDFDYLKCEKRETIYLFSILVGFLVTSNFLSWYNGFVVYIILYSVLIFTLYRLEVNECIKYIKNSIYGIRRMICKTE